MNKLILIILIVTNSAFGQNKTKESQNFELLESNTIENYKVPDSILFYAANHVEMSYQYDLIFERIRKKTKKSEIKTGYSFKSVLDSDNSKLFYNSETIFIENKGYDTVCFFDITTIDEDEKKFCEDKKCEFLFYIKLFDFTTNKVLVKRKYKVRTDKYYYTEAKELADLIIKELELKNERSIHNRRN
nr:hypothetical protein [uncultured Psychroserpens sp.]